jgi:hypothetical protein
LITHPQTIAIPVDTIPNRGRTLTERGDNLYMENRRKIGSSELRQTDGKDLRRWLRV